MSTSQEMTALGLLGRLRRQLRQARDWMGSPAFDLSTEGSTWQQLQAVYAADPRLRPNPAMHDYQLTYPPAIQLERPSHRRCPSDAELREQAIGGFRNMALYFHFGFCQYRCRYCFHYELLTNGRDDLMRRYVDALGLEMRRFARLTADVRPVLYFLGGGTPTALPVELLQRFLDNLLDVFGRPPTSMSTVEAKPVTATDDKLAALVRAGFRRINLGVQTLDPELYAFHHQRESLSIALDAIERTRRAGFEWINIDIMTGLERQTPRSWDLTLTALEQLAESGAVDSVFIYPFHDDPRSRTYDNEGRVPPLRETMFSDTQARAMFERLGWKELGARFYRSPRHVRRELWELVQLRVNPSYGEVLYHGFGNSSFSIGDRATYLNQRDVVRYCEQVESGELGIAHFTPLDDRQRATRDLTFDLLYSPMTRVRSLESKYGASSMRAHRRELERWTALGLGRFNPLLGTWSLSRLGKLVHQQMLPALYLPQDQRVFLKVMSERREAGKRYRGY